MLQETNFNEIEKKCRVNTKELLLYPPIALSMGEVTLRTKNGAKIFPIPLGTYGNFSFVSAPPKTHKTYFISLLASVYIAGSNRFGGDMRGFREDKCLVHFDTEQGKYHAQRVFARVNDMAEIDKEDICYHTFALRTIGYKTRIEFIDYYLKKQENLGLVIIDGIADLCSDVNNIVEANEVVQRIMEWSANYNCHIICVIHSNWGSEKPTGHLGSFMEKKTETHIQLEKNILNEITVKCKRSRGFTFENFSFKINDFGLPVIVKEMYDPLKNMNF
ncbi:MAG: AAA family ATPase [Pelagibacterales bacterium]|nr:AAA family ATPase [Pelagibacterales bacterium]